MTRIFALLTPSGKIRLRKASQSLGCVLLFGALLGSGTCNQNQNSARSGRVTLTKMPVTISGCAPKFDPIVTDTKNDVKWQSADGQDYTITFDQKFDLNNSPPNDITPLRNSTPPPASTPLSVPKSGTPATWSTSNTPTNCSIVSVSAGGTRNAGCYYKYSISYAGGNVCNDPGVLVQPD